MASISGQVMPGAQLAQRHNVVRSRVVVRNNGAAQPAKLSRHGEGQGVGRAVRPDVEVVSADFHLNAALNKGRPATLTHTLTLPRPRGIRETAPETDLNASWFCARNAPSALLGTGIVRNDGVAVGALRPAP